jgi:hypothetical protein
VSQVFDLREVRDLLLVQLIEPVAIREPHATAEEVNAIQLDFAVAQPMNILVLGNHLAHPLLDTYRRNCGVVFVVPFDHNDMTCVLRKEFENWLNTLIWLATENDRITSDDQEVQIRHDFDALQDVLRPSVEFGVEIADELESHHSRLPQAKKLIVLSSFCETSQAARAEGR